MGSLIMTTPKKELLMILVNIFFLSYSSLLSQGLAPAGTIERITKQQLLTSIPPNHEPTPTGSSQLFLTSPSGKYAAFLIRRETSIGAGGFGSDFCYIQIQESSKSVWESECTPVSNVNSCNLLFSDGGLEIFDGSRSAWDGDVDGENLETLELLDKGDMTVRDKYGNQVWKASDNPLSNQNCGSIGSPGLSPVLPHFAGPIHGGRGPFGQPIAPVVNTALANQVQDNKVASGPLDPTAVKGNDIAQQPQEEQKTTTVPDPLGSGAALGDEGLQQPQQEPNATTVPGPLGSTAEVGDEGVEQPNDQDQLGAPAEGPVADAQQQQGQLGGDLTQGLDGSQPGLSSAGLNQPAANLNQQFGGGVTQKHQPLLDNIPFDSGSLIGENAFKFGVAAVFTTVLTSLGVLF